MHQQVRRIVVTEPAIPQRLSRPFGLLMCVVLVAVSTSADAIFYRTASGSWVSPSSPGWVCNPWRNGYGEDNWDHSLGAYISDEGYYECIFDLTGNVDGRAYEACGDYEDRGFYKRTFGDPSVCDECNESDGWTNCGYQPVKPHQEKPHCPAVGNPVNPITGNKHQKETDIPTGAAGQLMFTRYYNSESSYGGSALGPHWRHTYETSIAFEEVGTFTEAKVVRPEGQEHHFRWMPDIQEWKPLSNTRDRLEDIVTESNELLGLRFITEAGQIATYDVEGRLQSTQPAAGVLLQLTYSETTGLLSSVTDDFGVALSFHYDATHSDGSPRLTSVTGPAGLSIQFQFDAQDNLIEAIYPHVTAAGSTIDAIREYRYEDEDYPTALTGIIDERNVRFATWSYDANGRADSSEHAGGVDAVSVAHDLASNSSTITNASGTVEHFQYRIINGERKLTKIETTDEDGNVTIRRHSYFKDGQLASTVDERNNRVEYHYDGDQVSRTEAHGTPDERTIITDMHPVFRQPDVVTEPGRTMDYDYNDRGQVTAIAVTDTESEPNVTRTTTYHYDASWRLQEIDGPRTDISDRTTFTYHPGTNNRATMTDAMGHVTRYTNYDAAGRLLREIDPNGLITSYTYHPRGWLLTETLGEGAGAATTRYDYDPVGNLIQVTLPTGDITAFNYDAAGRLVEVYDSQNNRIVIDHLQDEQGKREVIEIQTAQGGRTFTLTRWYNDRDLVSKIVDGAGRETEYLYDARGNLETVIDGKGQSTVYRYDALNRVDEMVDRATGLTEFGYDALDHLRTVTDPNGNTTSYGMDVLGNERYVDSPDTGSTDYDHDEAGNVTRMLDMKDQEFISTYDALNRLIHVDAPGTVDDVTFQYDGACSFSKGRLCSVSRGSTQVDFHYAQRGQVWIMMQTVDTWEFSPGLDTAVSLVGYGYDASGRVTGVYYPDGTTVEYVYDSIGNIRDIDLTTDGVTTPLMSGATYLPFGPMSGATLSNGTGFAYIYDQAYEFQMQANGAFIEWVTRDDNANLMTHNHGMMGSLDYTYDALDRLDTVTASIGIPNFEYDFDYDPTGNRTQQIADGVLTSYTYEPSSNRLIEIDFDAVGVDANGNTTALHGMSLGYTSDNRLSTVDGLGFARYNGLGQRVMKETLIPGSNFWRRAKVYVYGKDGELLAETGPKGGVTRNYIYLNGRLIALVDRIPSSSERFLRADFDNDGMISVRDYAEWRFLHPGDPDYDVTGDGVNDGADDMFLVDCVNQSNCFASDYEHRVYTVHSDRLGTPYMLKDESATSVWEARYDPFGIAEVDEDPDGDGDTVTLNVRFPGQYYDEETGLHYNYFRDYDPSTGRYIQSDPIGLRGGLNTYAYAAANPLRYIDPLGLHHGPKHGQMGHGMVGDPGPRGFGGQFGTTTVGPGGWGQSASVGVAGFYEVCEKPKECSDDTDPPFASPPDSVSGTWYLFGTTVKPDGTVCFQFGLIATWPPIAPNWNLPSRQ